VYLKSLTLKGFKSFADPTTLELEPGVTVVVGPNGSGKSNVVDAVAWVLGAQGPRVVRSARMDDVIFAGTSKRSALGRAEVSLTIDNSSRRLPIDLNEVTVTRTLFRTGESEYALNGVPCRLLDVQELLSDSGVGRQQHVIIGQGQLDAVLAARPEDRRMVIEEAAGILKFRRRRERAERRLETSEAGLARLQDLLREVRRQLKPLERQAASALRHEELAGELRALRMFVAGRELVELNERLSGGGRALAGLDEEASRVGAELERLDAALAHAQGELGEERAEELTPLVGRLEQLVERARGLLALSQERRRARAALAAAQEDADAIVALETEHARVLEDLERTEAGARTLAPEWEALRAAEAQLAEAEERHAEQFGIAEAPGPAPEAAAVRAEHARAREELAARREAEVRAAERAAALVRRREEGESRRVRAASALEAIAPELDEARRAHARLAAAEEGAGVAARQAEEALRDADEQRHADEARVEALELALDEVRARAGLERLAGVPGVVGTLLDVVEVDDSVALAFEAAVEGVLDVVLVSDGEEARAALQHLRAASLGGSVLPLAGAFVSPAAGGWAPAPTGTERLRDRVRAAEPAVDRLLDALLEGVLLVTGGFDAALDAALGAPGRTIVTSEGDRFSPLGWRIGAGRAGATRAALEAARGRAGAAVARADAAAGAEREARSALGAARAAAADALRRLDQLAGELGRNEETAADAERELGAVATDEARAGEEHARATAAVQEATASLGAASARLAVVEAEEEASAARAGEAGQARRALDERARALGALRRDLEVRVAALEERRSMLSARRAELAEGIARRHEEHRRAEERRGAHEVEDLALSRLAARLQGCESKVVEGVGRLGAERDRRAEASRQRLERVGALRRQRDEAERSLAAGRERRQRLELDLTEARIRHETAVEALHRDLDAVADEAIAAPRPELPEGTDPTARWREVERELRMLGPVNPLAREELAALQERSGFLETQLEDVRSARRELGQVIQAIDTEIVSIFSSAYEDVAGHFQALFTTLFPGGSGQLSLTAPDDPLSTGVEIEARPAGRNVRRLSLLSGGERSLVAMAFLFAVFRSRPSPFYLMDEVEAALDEVNLRRFLDLVHEFRDEAQLIIVSHQKKTMEVADALYGISMQPGGASKVVSEKVRSGVDLP